MRPPFARSVPSAAARADSVAPPRAARARAGSLGAFPRLALAVAVLAAALSHARVARALWPTSTSSGEVAAHVTYSQPRLGASVTDAFGNTLLCWSDDTFRYPSGRLVFAQRISSNGARAWGLYGLAVSASPAGTTPLPDLVADGSGGAYVAWYDSVHAATYAQHLDASGARLWGTNGVAAHTDAAGGGLARVMPDGAGGIYVAFLHRNTSAVRIQRFDSGGTRLWGNGVVIGAAGPQYAPELPTGLEMVPDSALGAIVVWEDSWTYAIRAQRVSSAGATTWTSGGVSVYPGRFVLRPRAVADGADGVFVAMLNDYTSVLPGIYMAQVQRLSSSGARLWGAGGFELPIGAGPVQPAIAPDGSGGVLVGVKNWGNATVTAQRLNASGSPLSGAGPIVLATTLTSYPGAVETARLLDVTGDGAGGMVVTWPDGSATTRAQRVEAAGTVAWAAGGVPVFAGFGTLPRVRVSALPGIGAVVTESNETEVTRVRLLWPDGTLGVAGPQVATALDVPADQGGHVAIAWNASPLESHATSPMTSYRVWRRNPGAPALARDERGAGPASLATRPWELLATLPARGLAGYAFVAPTLADSTSPSSPATEFKVESVSALVTAESPSAFVRSVDNLPPLPPAPLPALATPQGIRLRWLPADDAVRYRVYRDRDPAFEPDATNLLGEVADTAYVDASPDGGAYKVAAVDAHGNASAGAPLLEGATLDTPDRVARAMSLAAPSPNPLHGGATTVLCFTLPASGPATLALFDVTGRRVRMLARGNHLAGAHTVAFDGRDRDGRELAAGLYFARLDAVGRTLVRRLVVTP